MVLEAAQDKNITFRVRGRGNLNFVGSTTGSGTGDGDNDGGGGGMLIGGGRRLEQRLTRLETSVNGGEGMQERLRQMEERITQLTVRMENHFVLFFD